MLSESPAGARRQPDARHRRRRGSQGNGYILNLQTPVIAGAGGHGGEGEHFPAFRACSGGGGSGAGQRSRSPPCPPALRFVDLPGRPIAVRLMQALLVVEVQPRPDSPRAPKWPAMPPCGATHSRAAPGPDGRADPSAAEQGTLAADGQLGMRAVDHCATRARPTCRASWTKNPSPR